MCLVSCNFQQLLPGDFVWSAGQQNPCCVWGYTHTHTLTISLLYIEINLSRFHGLQALSDVHLLIFMCVFVCCTACESELSVVYMCVNLLVQWCEAAGLWLSVQKHTKGRRDYNRFKCCFGHLTEIIQNGATMVPSLNCSRLLLQAATFLRKNATCVNAQYYFTVQVWMSGTFLTVDFLAWDRKSAGFVCAQAGLHAYPLMCVWVSLVELWRKRVELRAQGPGDLSWTSSFFFLKRFSCWSDRIMWTGLF